MFGRIISGDDAGPFVCGGYGVSCENFCGSNAVEAYIVFNDSSNLGAFRFWCTEVPTLFNSTASAAASAAAPPHSFRKPRSLCACNFPIFFLGWCTSRVSTASQLENYPICCLHPFIKQKVAGSLYTCCRMGICF